MPGKANLTVGGAVQFEWVGGSAGWMHPEEYRRSFGEKEYEALLARPRVVSEYDGCDCPSCARENAKEQDGLQ